MTIPKKVEEMFIWLCSQSRAKHRSATLVKMRDKISGEPRYMVFHLVPMPDDLTLGRFEIVGEIYDQDTGQQVLDRVENYPESGLDMRPPTDIPPAFR